MQRPITTTASDPRNRSPRLPVHRHATAAFTLAEVLAAVMVGTMVVIVALVTLRQVSNSRALVTEYSDLHAAGRYALNRMRHDLANVYRGAEIGEVRFSGTRAGLGPTAGSRLMFLAVLDQPIGSREVRGDTYAVEYRLLQDDQGAAFLGRRCAPAEDLTAAAGAGVLTRLATNVTDLNFAYYQDGIWHEQWDPGRELPGMVRVDLKLTAPQENGSTVSLSQVIALSPRPGEALAPTQGTPAETAPERISDVPTP